jgi:predicted nucleic acid-binding protein
MIVVDTNVLLAAVIRGASSQLTLAVRRTDSDWIAPPLLRSEFLNALAKYVVVARTMHRDQALKAFRRGLDMVRLAAEESDPVSVLNICSNSGLTSYDAEFVSLATKLNVRLVTMDVAVLKAYPDLAVSISDFAAGR